MIKWIQQDLKRILKSHKTYILMIVLMLSMVNYISINNDQEVPTYQTYILNKNGEFIEATIPRSLETIRNIQFAYDNRCHVDFDGAKDADYCDDYNQFLQYLEYLTSDISDEQYYKIIMVILNKTTNNFLNYYDVQLDSVKEKLDTYLLDIDFIYEMKHDIELNIEPEFSHFQIPYINSDVTSFNLETMQLYETYTNFKNEYPRDAIYTMTSSFFIANYINDHSLLLLVAGVLLIFDSFYRDYKLGVTKNILSAPIKRHTYMITKTISSLLGLFIIIFIPLIICVLGLYVINEYDTLNYPIYTSRMTLKSFTPERSYARASLETLQSSSYKDICTVEPATKFSIDYDREASLNTLACRYLIPANTLRVTPLKSYIGITVVYLILLIVFLASLNTMMSLILSNQVVNAIVLLAIVIGSSTVTSAFMGNSLLKFLPTTFMSPTALMMQTIPFTMLNGFVTMTLWSVSITLINYYLMKHKDFTY